MFCKSTMKTYRLILQDSIEVIWIIFLSRRDVFLPLLQTSFNDPELDFVVENEEFRSLLKMAQSNDSSSDVRDPEFVQKIQVKERRNYVKYI